MTLATPKTYEGKPCPKGHTERRVSNNACVACSREKANEYYKENRDAVLKRMPSHKKPCPAKKSEWRKNWRDKNPDYFRDRYESKKDEILEKQKNYRECNKEKVSASKKLEREKNKDAYNARLRKWKKLNQGKVLAEGAQRRALMISAIPPWADMGKIKQIYDECPEGYHVDHYYPLKHKNFCGLHVENNLRAIPAKENMRKNNTSPEDFYGELHPLI